MTGGAVDTAAAQVAPDVGNRSGRASVVALVTAGEDLSTWWASVISLTRSGADVILLSRVPEDVLLAGHRLDVRVSNRTLSQAFDDESRRGYSAVLVVTAPVVMPAAAFDRALELTDKGGQICTVSFLSNNAGYLSFPDRNATSGLVPSGHDADTITQALRASKRSVGATPIPVPAGSAVLVPSVIGRTLGGLRPSIADPDVVVLDLALRGVSRGFVNVLDASTFVTTPLLHNQRADPRHDPGVREQLTRAHPFFPALYDLERTAENVPLADVLHLRRAELIGVDVLVDGSCFGPYEQGTQVAVLANISALAAHPQIGRVVVAMPSPEMPPPYTLAVLHHPKIQLCRDQGGSFPDAPPVDVIHRQFQPHGGLPLARWAEVGRRLVITVQDLIAYNNGYYHPNSAEWLEYRSAMADTLVRLDAVVAISHDTEQAIRAAGILPFPGKITVVPNGTDHLSGMHGRMAVPDALLELESSAARYALVLGTNYAHKNRDLAIRAWQELRRRGHQLELVLAGVVVPVGSTRNEEMLAAVGGPEPIVLPDVSDDERNWL
ncbi:MAG TPA: glycosyltransferase, partial [Nakamurella sp.]